MDFPVMSEKEKPSIKLNARLLPLLVVVVTAMQLMDAYRGWIILLVVLGGLWLVSYRWARSLAIGLALEREMRYGWAQVGDRLEERFTLANSGWAPAMWVEIEDHSTLPGYKASSVRAVGSKWTTRWRTRGLCTQRGLFTLGSTSLITGDPFGVYTVRSHFPPQTDMLVMPAVVPLPHIEVAPGGRVGEGQPRPYSFERTVSAAGVRDYQTGDEVRSIHWPTTARRDTLSVRLFESTPTSDWWVVVDVNRHVQVGEGWNSTEEQGIILAASLADRGLRNGRAVGLVANSADPIWLSPQEGESHRIAILHALALLESGDRSLQEFLERLPPYFCRLASLIIITPDMDSKWVKDLFLVIERGATPTVLLLETDPLTNPLKAQNLSSSLSALGIANYVITPEMLDRPEARPGERGLWEWRTSATGRAVPIRRPHDVAWRKLT